MGKLYRSGQIETAMPLDQNLYFTSNGLDHSRNTGYGIVEFLFGQGQVGGTKGVPFQTFETFLDHFLGLDGKFFRGFCRGAPTVRITGDLAPDLAAEQPIDG